MRPDSFQCGQFIFLQSKTRALNGPCQEVMPKEFLALGLEIFGTTLGPSSRPDMPPYAKRVFLSL